MTMEWTECNDCIYGKEGDCENRESQDGCYFGLTEEE